MDNDTARHFFEHGGSLIFMGLPTGSEFGIDLNSWTVKETFKGVKMIPPGIHFAFYCAVEKKDIGPQCGPKTGFFFWVDPKSNKSGNTFVKLWNSSNEDVEDENLLDILQIERIKAANREFEPYMGAYTSMKESFSKWSKLTCFITEKTVDSHQPISKKVSSVTVVNSDNPQLGTLKNTHLKEETASIPEYDSQKYFDSLQETPLHSFRFTFIPSSHSMKFYQPSFHTEQQPVSLSSGSLITSLNLDKSHLLKQLLQKEYQNDYRQLLAELQLCFVVFLVGEVFQGFEQWKRLLDLLCSSCKAITENVELYIQFLEVLYNQLMEIPQDFFMDELSKNNFLGALLKRFFWNLEGFEEEESLAMLCVAASNFKKYCVKRFGIEFEEESEEDQPVIVES